MCWAQWSWLRGRILTGNCNQVCNQHPEPSSVGDRDGPNFLKESSI